MKQVVTNSTNVTEMMIVACRTRQPRSRVQDVIERMVELGFNVHPHTG